MTRPQVATSRDASGRDTEEIEPNTETPLPQPDSEQDGTNTETTPFIPSHHQVSTPGGEQLQFGAVCIRVDTPFTLPQPELNNSTMEIERPARLPLTRTATEAATGGGPSDSFNPISQPSMSSSEAPHHDRGDNEGYPPQNTADHRDPPVYTGRIFEVLIPFSFGITMEDFNSILRETDDTARKNMLAVLEKPLTTRLNTFCTMSLGIAGFGLSFTIASFVGGINIQNRAATHDLLCTICWSISIGSIHVDACCLRSTYFIYLPTDSRIDKRRVCNPSPSDRRNHRAQAIKFHTIFAFFSALIFVWLRLTERSFLVPNDVPLTEFTAYLCYIPYFHPPRP